MRSIERLNLLPNNYQALLRQQHLGFMQTCYEHNAELQIQGQEGIKS